MRTSRSETCWRRHVVDEGVLAFDRRSGTNVLLRSGATAGLGREAPRVLQVGLTTACNLECRFCYRNAKTAASLDRRFLVEILAGAAGWGVLEVAFGGGEPLLYPDLLGLLRELREKTDLGLNVTTNGTLLTPTTAAELLDLVDEIRVSALEHNDYRRVLRMLAGGNVGVNLLVTPANVGLLEPCVRDCVALGARSVLLLGYKGAEPGLHLGTEGLARLSRTVLRMKHLPLRLDACWYPLLPEVPHLFPRSDCGAGDELLVITPDQAVQPCSFHQERIPFASIEDLQTIYRDLRQRRPQANVCGCTRGLFAPCPSPELPAPGKLWIWQARSSNNSGDWTIVGRFQTPEQARQAADSLRELSRAHEAFLASPEGHQWLVEHDYYGNFPTPPLQLFGQQHGVDWSGEDQGLWWEEDGAGAPVLTAGAVGDCVVVYHPYCMGLPEQVFQEFFRTVGAMEFGYWQYERPAVVVRTHGGNPAAVEALSEYIALVEAAEYPSQVKASPPWGSECHDPRVFADEDRSARLAAGRKEVQYEGGKLHLALAMENTFAGALALASWLSAEGFQDIEVSVDDILEPLHKGGSMSAEPKTGLFGDVRPLADRLQDASAETVVRWIFNYHSNVPETLDEAMKQIPGPQRLELARTEWQRCRTEGRDVTWQALRCIEDLGPVAADWMREVWQDLGGKESVPMGVAIKAMAVSLPADEAFGLASAWAEQAEDREARKQRLMLLHGLGDPRTLSLIEQWWASAEPQIPVTEEWGTLAAASGMSWSAAGEWLRRGRPLSLIALGGLLAYVPRPGYPRYELPQGFGHPDITAFQTVLAAYRKTDPAPRAAQTIDRLLQSAGLFTR